MSKRMTKKTQKMLGSLLGVMIVAVIGLLGLNIELTDTLTNRNVVPTNLTTEDSLQVYFIDVGQADSILITQNKNAMLIDAGNNEDGPDVVKFLEEKGIQKLDYLVGTHPHEDHIGGLDDVIKSEIEIKNILMPKIQTNTKTFEAVLDAIAAKGLKVTAPGKGDRVEVGKTQCEIMNDSIIDNKNLNLSSIIIRLQFGETSFLFMGDAETKNEEQRKWTQTNVLKVGHHGSNTSSSEKFLKQVQPQYSVIMAGKDNSYGLPKSNILERIQTIGSKLYRTDMDGTIKMTSDGKTIQIETNQ